MLLRIRELRKDSDYTQKDIAEYLGVRQQTYSRYESGEITISTYDLVKLAHLYNTSVDYLLDLTDVIKPHKRITHFVGYENKRKKIK